MAGAIFVLRDDGQIVPMLDAPYASEDFLQDILARYPELLAGDQIDPEVPRRWLLVSREIDVPVEDNGSGRWAVDHLYLDQDGIPTLVEEKRSTDTRIRREVVGQMLDYAANAVAYWTVEGIRARYVATCERLGRDPEVVISAFLGPERGPEEFWQTAKTNLQAGRIRLLFVADKIPPELQRIVEFLNQQMDPAEVIAVELRQFVGKELRTLVPRVIGQTAAARARKSPGIPERTWDEASFFEQIEQRCGADQARVARRILEWARTNGQTIEWGRGRKDGSLMPKLTIGGLTHCLVVLWTYGRLEIQFEQMKLRPPFDSETLRIELVHRLNDALRGSPASAMSDEVITRRPSISLAVLTDDARLNGLLGALDWAISQIRSS